MRRVYSGARRAHCPFRSPLPRFLAFGFSLSAMTLAAVRGSSMRAPRRRSARTSVSARQTKRRSRRFCERAMLRFRERDTTHDKRDATTLMMTTTTRSTALLLLLLRTVHAPGGHRARIRVNESTFARLRAVPPRAYIYICVYISIYVCINSLSHRDSESPRRARLEYSVPTAGDGELERAALPRGDQSRRRIHRGGFPHRRAISLPRDAALGQSWQARRRADPVRERAISSEHRSGADFTPTPLREPCVVALLLLSSCCVIIIVVDERAREILPPFADDVPEVDEPVS